MAQKEFRKNPELVYSAEEISVLVLWAAVGAYELPWPMFCQHILSHPEWAEVLGVETQADLDRLGDGLEHCQGRLIELAVRGGQLPTGRNPQQGDLHRKEAALCSRRRMVVPLAELRAVLHELVEVLVRCQVIDGRAWVVDLTRVPTYSSVSKTYPDRANGKSDPEAAFCGYRDNDGGFQFGYCLVWIVDFKTELPIEVGYREIKQNHAFGRTLSTELAQVYGQLVLSFLAYTCLSVTRLMRISDDWICATSCKSLQDSVVINSVSLNIRSTGREDCYHQENHQNCKHEKIGVTDDFIQGCHFVSQSSNGCLCCSHYVRFL